MKHKLLDKIKEKKKPKKIRVYQNKKTATKMKEKIKKTKPAKIQTKNHYPAQIKTKKRKQKK
jgi:hypothetical protein